MILWRLVCHTILAQFLLNLLAQSVPECHNSSRGFTDAAA